MNVETKVPQQCGDEELERNKLCITAILGMDLSVSEVVDVPPPPPDPHADFVFPYPISGHLVIPESSVRVQFPEGDPLTLQMGPKSSVHLFDERIGPGSYSGINQGTYVNLRRKLRDEADQETARSDDFFQPPFNCRAQVSMRADLYERMEREVRSGALRRIRVRATMWMDQPVLRTDCIGSVRYSVEFLYGCYEMEEFGWL